jgi:hypothetical protein
LQIFDRAFRTMIHADNWYRSSQWRASRTTPQLPLRPHRRRHRSGTTASSQRWSLPLNPMERLQAIITTHLMTGHRRPKGSTQPSRHHQLSSRRQPQGPLEKAATTDPLHQNRNEAAPGSLHYAITTLAASLPAQTMYLTLSTSPPATATSLTTTPATTPATSPPAQTACPTCLTVPPVTVTATMRPAPDKARPGSPFHPQAATPRRPT